MTVDPTGTFKFADALKGWPLWLLGGAAVCLTLLALPPFAGIVPPPYGVAVPFAAIAAWILAVFKALSYLPSLVASRRAAAAAKQKFVITLVEHQCFWHIAKQPDGSFCTQISVRGMIKNRTTEPLHLMKAKVLRPKIGGEQLPGVVTTQAPDSHMHGTAYVSGYNVPAGMTLAMSATLLFKGTPKQKSGKLAAIIEFQDADANVVRVGVTLPCT